MKIGVLALQGAFREHITMLEALGVSASAVRLPVQLEGLDGLIIPGGESTAISKLMVNYGFYDAISAAAGDGLGVWGTCAGLILMAHEVDDGIEDQRSLDLIDVVARRNAFGRQRDSFEAPLDFKGVGEYTGVFIRAPWIESVGTGVEVLAFHEGHIVAAGKSNMMVTAFHPELTSDDSIHRYFIERIL
ncbi:MAG: pyridoxal 5'-phosphate synthase glutaminase subunit PdxT [Coriobacteriia bacterium]|nr:pyridoxal 5'-phosphate synthase glutaminase subunit PdxT [Coriobacteriia bacterium]